MKEFMSYVIIISLIAFVGFICYMIYKKNQITVDPPVVPPVFPDGASEDGSEIHKNDDVTTLLIEWFISQLDPNSGIPVKTEPVIIPKSGKFTVGRKECCSFVLKNVSGSDGVSREHLGVGKDSQGYFARPLRRNDGSLALTYIDDQLIMDSFDLEDQKVIWLGNIPIAFVKNVRHGKDLKFNPGTSDRSEEDFKRDHEDTKQYGETNESASDDTFER